MNTTTGCAARSGIGDSRWSSGSAGKSRAAGLVCVGAGMIGRIFIGMARALGADVCWRLRPVPLGRSRRGARRDKTGTARVRGTLPIVVIHAPTTPETHHMIGAKELALMPDNGYLVCTARSWVVDQDALMAELESGRIRAALDVFDEEPMALDHPFRSLPNVPLTPHIAGATDTDPDPAGRMRGARSGERVRRATARPRSHAQSASEIIAKPQGIRFEEFGSNRVAGQVAFGKNTSWPTLVCCQVSPSRTIALMIPSIRRAQATSATFLSLPRAQSC